MSDTDILAALKVVDLRDKKTKLERQQFIDKIFLVALEMALKQNDWTTGEGDDKKPINSLAGRVNLAIDITREAYKRRLLAQ